MNTKQLIQAAELANEYERTVEAILEIETLTGVHRLTEAAKMAMDGHDVRELVQALQLASLRSVNVEEATKARLASYIVERCAKGEPLSENTIYRHLQTLEVLN